MPTFKIVNNVNEICVSSHWVESTQFYGKDKLVNRQGEYVGDTYSGPKYQLISKKQRDYSNSERVGRGFLGVLAIVCSLGLALFCKSIRNLFIKQKETVRFGVLIHQSGTTSQPKMTEEDCTISRRELEQNVTISEKTISKIQISMKKILYRQEEEGIKLYHCQADHRVFTLDSEPGLIFKMKADKNCHAVGRDDSMKARFQKMINAQTVIRTHQLGLLIIPKAKMLHVKAEGEEYEVIVEQKMDINPNPSMQEQYFQDSASRLDETIRQLSMFICKTGYSDVEWRNIPIINTDLEGDGDRKIALIDIEEMDGAVDGLFGVGLLRRGLVGCVNEKQGKIIEEVARHNKINLASFEKAYARRKEELEDGRKLKEFYTAKKIFVGDEPVRVEKIALHFSNYPKQAKKLEKLTLELIQAVNDKISKSSSEESVKGRRYVLINTNREPFLGVGTMLIDEKATFNSFETEEAYENATFLGYIVQKLVDLKVLFKLVRRNGHGYFIQA